MPLTFKLDLPGNDLSRFVNGLCDAYGFEGTPAEKEAKFKEMMEFFATTFALDYEVRENGKGVMKNDADPLVAFSKKPKMQNRPADVTPPVTVPPVRPPQG